MHSYIALMWRLTTSSGTGVVATRGRTRPAWGPCSTGAGGLARRRGRPQQRPTCVAKSCGGDGGGEVVRWFLCLCFSHGGSWLVAHGSWALGVQFFRKGWSGRCTNEGCRRTTDENRVADGQTLPTSYSRDRDIGVAWNSKTTSIASLSRPCLSPCTLHLGTDTCG